MKWINQFVGLALGLALSLSAHADNARWALVDTTAHTLTILDAANRTLERFDNVAFGRGGVAPLHAKGDHTTPLGEFRITHIKPSRRFETFFGLNYPTAAHAEQAFSRGIIDAGTRNGIQNTPLAGIPPQNTVLGGAIGIHGIGRGSLRIHSMAYWTAGCVALTNQQLRRFAKWAEPGMRVVIK